MGASDTIVIGSDHAGYKLKELIKGELRKRGIAYEDVGAHAMDPRDDYPLYAARVGRSVSLGKYERGVAMCGSGIGASMVANRFRKVRAALCVTPQMAETARRHNDSNVLVMGERTIDEDTARKILHTWLDTTFDGGRHRRRLELVDAEADKQE